MKHTNLYEEIEMYESRKDKMVLTFMVLIIILSIGLILWNPNVEKIGETVFLRGDMDSNGELNIIDL
jgi:competence protein ComGC